MSKKNRLWDSSALMAASSIWFRKTVFGRNYQFSGQTLAVIKLSIKSKSKKNNNVNLSSNTTNFWDKDGEKLFHELPVFGQR